MNGQNNALVGLLSAKETCTYLGIKPTKLGSLTRSKELPSVKIGRRRLYRRTDLDRFVERSMRKAG